MKVITLDQEFLGTRHAIASFLVEGPAGYILVESGPATTQDTLERKVREVGVEPKDIQNVLVTHIHLDHSGGAGYWARRGAKVYVHPKGARHLIDPARLLASAKRIYQDQMDTLWGQTLPIDAEKVVEFSEPKLTIAGLEVEALDTPGHATHHLAYRIGDSVFTGDVAGCRLTGSKFVSVPAPPPEFNLETWLQSLQRLRELKASRLYLTHFGEVSDVDFHLDQLESRLALCVDFVKAHQETPAEELAALYQAWDRTQAREWDVDDLTYSAYERANPSFMSAQGITRYLSKL